MAYGYFPEAEACYRRAAALQPGSFWIVYGWAFCLERLGRTDEAIERFLGDTPPGQSAQNVAEEYIQLFIGPHNPEINAYESVYLTGRLFDRPLADIRTFLKAVGIEKVDEYSEPEDFLAFELEVMRWFVGKQLGATNPEEEKRWLRLQSEFLKEHLLVWAPACARWKKRTRRNNGTVAETTAATANITLFSAWMVPRKLEIFGTMVWLSWLSSIAVTAKSL